MKLIDKQSTSIKFPRWLSSKYSYENFTLRSLIKLLFFISALVWIVSFIVFIIAEIVFDKNLEIVIPILFVSGWFVFLELFLDWLEGRFEPQK